MQTRRANSAQLWYCPNCESAMVHKIGNRDLDVGDGPEHSKWVTYDDRYVYRRVRQCTECAQPLETVELAKAEFLNLVLASKRLSNLEQFRNDVETAIGRVRAP